MAKLYTQQAADCTIQVNHYIAVSALFWCHQDAHIFAYTLPMCTTDLAYCWNVLCMQLQLHMQCMVWRLTTHCMGGCRCMLSAEEPWSSVIDPASMQLAYWAVPVDTRLKCSLHVLLCSMNVASGRCRFCVV